MFKKIALAALTISAAFILAIFPFGISRADEIVVKGTAKFMDMETRTPVTIQEPIDGRYTLVISKNEAGDYVWVSNGNKKLIKIEEKSDLRTEFTIFLNPDGYGAIVLKNMDYITCETDIRSSNYKAYVRKPFGWGYFMSSGFTTPYPYPAPINCGKK